MALKVEFVVVTGWWIMLIVSIVYAARNWVSDIYTLANCIYIKSLHLSLFMTLLVEHKCLEAHQIVLNVHVWGLVSVTTSVHMCKPLEHWSSCIEIAWPPIMTTASWSLTFRFWSRLKSLVAFVIEISGLRANQDIKRIKHHAETYANRPSGKLCLGSITPDTSSTAYRANDCTIFKAFDRLERSAKVDNQEESAGTLGETLCHRQD